MIDTNMKTTHKALWAWLLLVALCCASGASARRVRMFSRPAWVGSTTSTIRITKVEFADTATIVSFHEKYKPGWWIRIVKESYLIGEDGRKYNAIRGEGITLGENYVTPPSGEGCFKVLFEPLPHKTRFFDFIEGHSRGAFHIYGVHEEGRAPKISEQQERFVMTPELEQQFFVADTACVKGRIEGYSRELGFSTMLYSQSNAMTNEDVPLTVDIREDGKFEFRFLAAHPVEGGFILQGKDYYKWLNFYAVPGQTTELVMKADGSVIYTSMPSGPFGRKRSLKYGFSEVASYPYDEFTTDADSLDFKGFSDCAMRKMRERLYVIDYMAWRFGYTPWERHLAECHTRLNYGMAVFDYDLNKSRDVTDASYTRELTEQEQQQLDGFRNPANYRFLREMPCNDISCLVFPCFGYFLNRYEFCSVMRNPFTMVRGMQPDSVAKQDAAMMAVDTKILESDTPSLLGRLVVLRALSNDLERQYCSMPSMLDSIYQNRLEYMNRTILRTQASRVLEQARRRCSLTYTLPDTEGGKILRRLTDKYKGKYVLIDFWGMFCGPCRSGIERSKLMREALRNHADVDFLFISTEGEDSEENYRKFVDEHLAGEDVVQVSRDDFNRLMELFNFLGIPHYETLDREGNVVRSGLHYAPEEQFRQHLEHLKQQLEH